MTNRLREEVSPYLKRHSEDLIDWYPWGEEALKKSKDENKPIYLSIGHLSSHWCRVMSKESFCNPEVVSLLNDDFVPVKVDREEHPELESVAMMTCQIMNSNGGWPLNVFLTPDLKPFFSAAYMPLEGNSKLPGMKDCLPRIKWLWLTENAAIQKAAEDIYDALKNASDPGKACAYDNLPDEAVKALLADADDKYGGFGDVPKFPNANKLMYLLEYGRLKNHKVCLSVVDKALSAMVTGGIKDHIGGGFFKYTSDRKWCSPYFEKTLCDQALLAMLYAEGFDVFQKVSYWRAADEALAYVFLNLRNPKKGFYSSESEDMDKHYYLWSEKDIDEVLGEDSALFKKAYNVIKRGNYKDEFTGKHTGFNVLYMTQSLESLADGSELGNAEDLADVIAKGCQKLSSTRLDRVRPERDCKVLTDWNGLLIAALARCGRIMDRPNYIKMAINEAAIIKGRSNLLHCDGISAFLNDYASMIWAAIELYRSTEANCWLEWAIELSERCVELFYDTENGGFFTTSTGGDGVLFRRKEVYDGITPSGNSIMAGNLVSIWKLSDQNRYLDLARETMSVISGIAVEKSDSQSHLMTAIIRLAD